MEEAEWKELLKHETKEDTKGKHHKSNNGIGAVGIGIMETMQEIQSKKIRRDCNGNCVGGPDRSNFWGTFCLVVTPHSIWWTIIGPYFSPAMKVFLYGISIFWFLWALLGLFMAGCTNPGIYPRRPATDADLLEEKSLKEQGYWAVVDAKEKTIYINGTPGTIKYCTTCHFWRAPRVSHCRVCDSCVDRLDHHCPWVGNCIGKRNYRFFCIFISSVVCCTFFLMLSSIAHIISVTDEIKDDSFWKKVWISVHQGLPRNTIPSICMILYTIMVAYPTTFLAGYTALMIYKGSTTHEAIKTDPEHSKIYDKGCLDNYFLALCPPWYPSFIKTEREDNEVWIANMKKKTKKICNYCNARNWRYYRWLLFVVSIHIIKYENRIQYH